MQLAGDGGLVLEKGVRLFHGHVQNLRDVAALPLHLQGFAVVALAVADVARHIHIGQKVHFHFHHAVALAGFAAAAAAGLRHVEGKAPGAVAALAGGGRFGHQLAHGRHQAGVGGRVAARGAAKGALVHGNHFVKVLQPLDGLVRGGFGLRVVELVRGNGQQRFIDQGAFARA